MRSSFPVLLLSEVDVLAEGVNPINSSGYQVSCLPTHGGWKYVTPWGEPAQGLSVLITTAARKASQPQGSAEKARGTY